MSSAGKLDDALKRQQAGQFVQAERLCQEVLSEEPGHPGALHRLGLLTWHAGDVDSAAELLRQALRSRPDDAAMHADLARILEAARRYDLAIDHGRKAVSSAPGNADLVRELARLKLAAGDAAGAEDALSRHVAAHAKDTTAWRLLARARAALGHAAGGVDALKQVIAHVPDSASAHRDLARLLAQCTNAEEALQRYRRALELAPDDHDAAAELAATALLLGDADAAAKVIRDCLEASPTHCGAIGMRALLAYRSGNQDEARRLADPGSMVRSTFSDRIPGFDSVAAFHRALITHVESHPTLRQTAQGGATQAVTDDLLVGQQGPTARLARIARDGIGVFLAADPFPAGHPFAGLPRSGWRLSMRARLPGPGVFRDDHGRDSILRATYVVRPGAGDASLSIEPGGVAVPVPEPSADAIRSIRAAAGTLAVYPGFMSCRFDNPPGAGPAVLVEIDAAPDR